MEKLVKNGHEHFQQKSSHRHAAFDLQITLSAPGVDAQPQIVEKPGAQPHRGGQRSRRQRQEYRCDGAKCMSRDVVYVCRYLVSTVRSGAAGYGAERSDAVRRIRSGAMRKRVASTNAIQKCLLIQQTSHYLRHFRA